MSEFCLQLACCSLPPLVYSAERVDTIPMLASKTVWEHARKLVGRNAGCKEPSRRPPTSFALGQGPGIRAMGTDQSKMGGYGEKGGGWAWRGGSKRTRPPVDPNTAVAASEGKPDVPPAHLARFTQALLAQMKTDIGDLNALASLIVGENYKASGKTIDEVKTEDGLTALHAAVLAEKPQVVKFLLECGCQPRTLSANWQTALHDAILKGNHDLVRLLLEFGAPNVCLSTNRIGELPLHTVRAFLPPLRRISFEVPSFIQFRTHSR